MLLDKDTVIKLLNQECEEYEANIIAINTLPENAVFNIEIEDTVMAEYYNEKKNDLMCFELDYSYLSTKRVNPNAQQNMDREIEESIKQQKLYGSNIGNTNLHHLATLWMKILGWSIFILSSFFILIFFYLRYS